MLQIAYIISRLVFKNRTHHSISLKENDFAQLYTWMLEKLARDLPLCKEEEQKISLYWLYDSEVYSNAKLHLDLEKVEKDCRIKKLILYDAVVLLEADLTKTEYTKDMTEIIEVYLDVAEKYYKEAIEDKV